MDSTICFSKHDFNNELSQFSALNQKKAYPNKVNYDDWRRLTKLEDVFMAINENGRVLIHGLLCGKTSYSFEFNATDNSLGAFFYNKYKGVLITPTNSDEYTINNAVFYDAKTNQPIMTIDKATLACESANTAASSMAELSGVSSSTTLNIGWQDQLTTTGGTYYYTNTTTNMIDSSKNDKENDTMDMKKMLNIEFGFITNNDSIRMSPYGMAVKNQAGSYVAYDKASGDIINVEVLNFKMDKMFMKMPVAVDNVAVGDMVIHNRVPCYVAGFAEDTGNPVVVDVYAGERKEIMLQRSPFGFNYVTKVVSLFDNMNVNADAANPFGNMWMFALMGDDVKFEDMMLPMMMMNGGKMDMNNPLMMLMMVMSGEKNSGNMMLPLMLMMNQQPKK